MPEISLHELNQHLFAHLLPETHGPKTTKKAAAKAAKADEAPAPEVKTVTLSDEQVAILTAAGITDPAADPQAVAGILAAAGLPL